MRYIRLIWRLPALLVHVLIILPITLLLISASSSQVVPGKLSLRHGAIRLWAAGTCRIFGLRLRLQGTVPQGPVLAVANHISWMDIVALHAVMAFSFIAKHEISSWPLLGLMARLSDTVFHQRGDAVSADGVRAQIRQRLERSQPVAVFPEGKTTRGDRVLRFHGRLLQPAIDLDVNVQPIAIRFRRGQTTCFEQAFAGNEVLLANILRLLSAAPTDVDLFFGPPIAVAGKSRRQVADQARETVVEFLQRDATWGQTSAKPMQLTPPTALPPGS